MSLFLSLSDLWALLFFLSILIVSIPFLGGTMARLFMHERTWLHPPLGWLERLSYRIGGIDPSEEMSWQEYAKALLLFNFFGFIALFLLLFFQGQLFLNPEHLPSLPFDLAFNIAASFVTNTNWQSYAGETTLSYLSQGAGLTVQNFLSAATGFCLLLALIRGLVRRNSDTIGNCWSDLVKSLVYVLFPLAFFFSLFLVYEGVPETLRPYVEVETLEGVKERIPLGPIASQEAIKQLGTNGGGFFNANSAHPFENPTPMTNLLETVAILLIPGALVYMYGVMTGARRGALLILLAMFVLWGFSLLGALFSESLANPALGVASPLLEGKETRFGLFPSILWSISTTAASNGSVNAMLSSLSPLSGGLALFNIVLGEVVFGGVGVGLCGMLMFVFLTVFLSGLMVGRTPEYQGKKIEAREMQWVMLAVLAPAALILIGSGLTLLLPSWVIHLQNQGPHSLTTILYAFASSAGNNGSSFANLDANTVWYNLSLGSVMIGTRLAILFSSLGLAGLFAKKKITPPSLGTFSTDSMLFFILLLSVILIVAALTFFPAFLLGPLLEHLLMLKGVTFT